MYYKLLRELNRQVNDAIPHWSAYVSLDYDESILDGYFTIEDLETIISAMKKLKEVHAQIND